MTGKSTIGTSSQAAGVNQARVSAVVISFDIDKFADGGAAYTFGKKTLLYTYPASGSDEPANAAPGVGVPFRFEGPIEWYQPFIVLLMAEGYKVVGSKQKQVRSATMSSIQRVSTGANVVVVDAQIRQQVDPLTDGLSLLLLSLPVFVGMSEADKRAVLRQRLYGFVRVDGTVTEFASFFGEVVPLAGTYATKYREPVYELAILNMCSITSSRLCTNTAPRRSLLCQDWCRKRRGK